MYEELVVVEVGVWEGDSASFEEDEEADDVVPEEEDGEEGAAMLSSIFVFFDALPLSFFNAIISFNATGIAFAPFAAFTAFAAFAETTGTGRGCVK